MLLLKLIIYTSCVGLNYIAPQSYMRIVPKGYVSIVFLCLYSMQLTGCPVLLLSMLKCTTRLLKSSADLPVSGVLLYLSVFYVCFAPT